MRSRMARVRARVSVLTAVMASVLTVLISGGVAAADPAGQAKALDSSPLESLSTPVGLTAVGLGITGMVAGVLRRKKTTVQPENQRKT